MSVARRGRTRTVDSPLIPTHRVPKLVSQYIIVAPVTRLPEKRSSSGSMMVRYRGLASRLRQPRHRICTAETTWLVFEPLLNGPSRHRGGGIVYSQPRYSLWLDDFTSKQESIHAVQLSGENSQQQEPLNISIAGNKSFGKQN
ncbi:hypothetical protein EVAR_68537_1 [Eumeta japonica]|uniref:Uncharacterized protein n=1 Tax=Eumeta variegata TaxID=151549 RepID=A0A4C1ZSJ3_EUMVA|nr:hypothetical protein EVAR_68537_1 [Eumeta japonica]